MKPIALVFACLALWSGVSFAGEIPRFDVEASCEQLASLGGEFSNTLFNSCIAGEQSAYDGLKGAWNSIPAGIRSQCVELATLGGPGSYTLLDSCIGMEMQAADNRASFSFE